MIHNGIKHKYIHKVDHIQIYSQSEPNTNISTNTNIFTKSITYKYIHKVNQIQIYLQRQQNTNIIKKLITSHTNVFLKSSVNRGGCQN